MCGQCGSTTKSSIRPPGLQSFLDSRTCWTTEDFIRRLKTPAEQTGSVFNAADDSREPSSVEAKMKFQSFEDCRKVDITRFRYELFEQCAIKSIGIPNHSKNN